MNSNNGREFIKLAASIGVVLARRSSAAHESKIPWREQRSFFPQGVVSGDPDSSSVNIL